MDSDSPEVSNTASWLVGVSTLLESSSKCLDNIHRVGQQGHGSTFWGAEWIVKMSGSASAWQAGVCWSPLSISIYS